MSEECTAEQRRLEGRLRSAIDDRLNGEAGQPSLAKQIDARTQSRNSINGDSISDADHKPDSSVEFVNLVRKWPFTFGQGTSFELPRFLGGFLQCLAVVLI